MMLASVLASARRLARAREQRPARARRSSAARERRESDAAASAPAAAASAAPPAKGGVLSRWFSKGGASTAPAPAAEGGLEPSESGRARGSDAAADSADGRLFLSEREITARLLPGRLLRARRAPLFAAPARTRRARSLARATGASGRMTSGGRGRCAPHGGSGARCACAGFGRGYVVFECTRPNPTSPWRPTPPIWLPATRADAILRGEIARTEPELRARTVEPVGSSINQELAEVLRGRHAPGRRDHPR